MLTVAKYTFLEAVRARFFVGIALFGAAAVLAGGFLGGVPWGAVDDVILNLGWAAISGMSIVLSTFYCVQMVARERERRTLHLWLARPISRPQYLLGKYIGLLALLVVTIPAMTALLAAAVKLWGNEPLVFRSYVIPAAWALMKAAVITAYAVFFSVVAAPLTAFFATFSVYVIGSSTETLLVFATEKGGEAGLLLAKWVYYAFPNFALIDVAERAIHGIGMPEPSFLWMAALVTLAYAPIVLVIGAIVFAIQEIV